jgi:hypothetical protein
MVSMKRCPKCNFIYLDTDSSCDLDATPLITVDEADADLSEAETASSKSSNKLLVGAAAAVVVILLAGSFVYYVAIRRTAAPESTLAQATPVPTSTPAQTPFSSPTPQSSIEPSPSPSPRVSPSPRNSPARGAVSSDPVSTSNQRAGAVTIRLTNGARIEADEVWRAKEGIWYRRNGMVTLLKANTVKAIERKR